MGDNKRKDNLHLNSFLRMGYFLDYQNGSYDFDLSEVNKDRYKYANEEDLVDIGSQLIKKTIGYYYRKSEDICVPLSGGLDSRAILAGLLEYTSATNIYTFTFGTPGTLDFDIGCHIAKMYGTKHAQFPFTEHEFSMDELLETSNCIDNQTVLFSTYPLFLLRRYYANHIILSGAFAGTTSGNVLMQNASDTIEGAKKNFINHGYTHVKSIKLTNCEDQELYRLLDINFIDKNLVTYEEQLHMKFAQLKWIAPHLLMKGFAFQAPFIDKEWVTFMLSVDNKFRSDQKLYRSILLYAFPKAFEYKTKSYFHGLPLNAGKAKIFAHKSLSKVKKILRTSGGGRYVKPGTNYIDFADGIRHRKDLNKIVYECINDLQDRKIADWIDIDKIWKDHLSCQKDHADALLVLASLEIHLKAMEQRGKNE